MNKIKQIAKALVAARPSIGIFWILNNEIIPISQELDELPTIAGYKDCKYDHYSVWHKIQNAFPKELENKEYDEVERGRITYNVDEDKFTVFVSKEVKSNSRAIGKIMYEYSLPRNKTKIESDVHYTLPMDLAASIFER